MPQKSPKKPLSQGHPVLTNVGPRLSSCFESKHCLSVAQKQSIAGGKWHEILLVSRGRVELHLINWLDKNSRFSSSYLRGSNQPHPLLWFAVSARTAIQFWTVSAFSLAGRKTEYQTSANLIFLMSQTQTKNRCNCYHSIKLLRISSVSCRRHKQRPGAFVTV